MVTRGLPGRRSACKSHRARLSASSTAWCSPRPFGHESPRRWPVRGVTFFAASGRAGAWALGGGGGWAVHPVTAPPSATSTLGSRSRDSPQPPSGGPPAQVGGVQAGRRNGRRRAGTPPGANPPRKRVCTITAQFDCPRSARNHSAGAGISPYRAIHIAAAGRGNSLIVTGYQEE
jgi:hypothetical protein